MSDWNSKLAWNVDISNLNLTEESVSFLSNNLGKKIQIPKEVLRLGDIHYEGNLHGRGKDLASKGTLETGAGKAYIQASKMGDHLQAKLLTPGIALNRIFPPSVFRYETLESKIISSFWQPTAFLILTAMREGNNCCNVCNA